MLNNVVIYLFAFLEGVGQLQSGKARENKQVNINIHVHCKDNTRTFIK